MSPAAVATAAAASTTVGSPMRSVVPSASRTGRSEGACSRAWNARQARLSGGILVLVLLLLLLLRRRRCRRYRHCRCYHRCRRCRRRCRRRCHRCGRRSCRWLPSGCHSWRPAGCATAHRLTLRQGAAFHGTARHSVPHASLGIPARRRCTIQGRYRGDAPCSAVTWASASPPSGDLREIRRFGCRLARWKATMGPPGASLCTAPRAVFRPMCAGVYD